jgi:hypothetical protein
MIIIISREKDLRLTREYYRSQSYDGMCVYVYLCVYARMYVWVYVRTYVPIYVYLHMHALCTYVPTYMYLHMHVYVLMDIRSLANPD